MAVGGFSAYGIAASYVQINNSNLDHFVNGFEVQSSLIPESAIDYNEMYDIIQRMEQLVGRFNTPRNLAGNNWPLVPLQVNFDYTKIPNHLKFYNKSFFNNTQLLNEFDPLDPHSPYNDYDIMFFGGDTAHVSLYTGLYVAGEAFRYAVAKREGDIAEITASLVRLRDLVDAYEILSEVGGNDTWPRYAVPITDLAKEKFPGYGFEATKDRNIVEYRGYNWSCVNHKSRDVTIGQMFAMSMIYNLVDDPDIRSRTGVIIDRTVSYLYESNWRIFDIDGQQHTTASELMSGRPSPSSLFVLTYLKMAERVNPDKWRPIYHHYAYDRGLAKALGKSDRAGFGYPSSNVGGAYYPLNFLYNSAPTLIWLEEDLDLKQIYRENLLDPAQNFVKFHRNGMFDVTYLLSHSYPYFDEMTKKPFLVEGYINDEDMVWGQVRDKINDPLEFVKSDIRDCVWRAVSRGYPHRNYYNDIFSFGDYVANPHQTPIDNNPSYYPEVAYWEGEGTDLMGALEDMLEGKTLGPAQKTLTSNSMPYDLRERQDCIWQRKSYGIEDLSNARTSQVGWSQLVPDILYVYWVARYLEIIPKSS